MKTRRVVIVGPPGSGKTSAGKILAERLQWTFLDSDELIENEAGMPVKEIFSQCGEAHFRLLETALIDRLLSEAGSPFVLATGGGIVVAPGNFEKLSSIGTVICLMAPADCLATRLEGDLSRPILNCAGPDGIAQTDKTQKLTSLLESRSKAYGQARYTIQTGALTPYEVASQIEKLIS